MAIVNWCARSAGRPPSKRSTRAFPDARAAPAVRRCAFMDHVGLCKTRFDIADLTVKLQQDVALRIADERVIGSVQLRSPRRHRVFRIENRWQLLIFDGDLAAAFLG